MIAQLTGLLIEKKPPTLVMDLHGVGYEIHAPMSTFYQLPACGETLTLLTHLSIREDAHVLFGFCTEQERKLFRALIKVNGVGPKLALTILSGIETDQFVQCILHQDESRLTHIPGIGKKTAERLIIEMKDALSQWEHKETLTQQLLTDPDQTLQDAIAALTALGYKPHDAKQAISKIHHPDHSSEQLIRQALQHMGRK
jgi:Holliday junction DNA helicase RuvA